MRYNIVTYMRIVACALVVQSHYGQMFDLPGWLSWGVVGPVAIFIVISGFLAYMSLERAGKSEGVKQYYIKRAKRLIPPYYIVLVMCIIFAMVNSADWSSQLNANWLRYFLFVNMIVPSENFGVWNNLYGFWTMGCFPFFYLVAPFLHKKLKNWKNALIIICSSMLLMFAGKIALLVILPRIGEFDDINSFATLNPVSILYLFVLGMVSAWAYCNKRMSEAAMVYGLLFVGMLVLGKNGYVMWGLATACVLLNPTVPFVFEKNKVICGIAKFFDKNSFNIYLLHLLIYYIWCKVNTINGIIGYISCILITIVLAEGLSRIEKTFGGRLCSQEKHY